jgi:hypothetical protein
MSAVKRQSAQKKRKKRRLHHSLVPVNPAKLNTGNSYSPWFWHDIFSCINGVYYYTNRPFICKDCGKECVWMAEDQKWWYEEIRGLVDTIAVRCRACRIRERERKAEARRVSEEGRARKRARMEQWLLR